MPNTREGIETGKEPELDLDSEAGFATFLARQTAGGEELSEEAQTALDRLGEHDTSVDAGLTFGEESAQRQRDPDTGRFAPAAREEPEAPKEGAAPATEEREGTDQELADFLARHGGDPSAALSAALKEKEEAQSLIGRQSAEVSAARKAEAEAAELRERLARVEGRLEATPTAPSTPIDVAALEERIAGPNGDGAGGQVVWDRAIQEVVRTGDKALLDTVAEVWGEYQPFQAARALNEFSLYVAEAQRDSDKEPEPKPDPLLEQVRSERQFKESLDTVKASVDEKDWKIVSPLLSESLQSAPPRVVQMVGSLDADEQRDGLAIVVELAKSRAIAKANATATEQATAEKAASKKAASVATGSLRPVQERQPASGEEMTKEQRTARFHELLLGTETTSVSEGLEYGGSRAS